MNFDAHNNSFDSADQDTLFVQQLHALPSYRESIDCLWADNPDLNDENALFIRERARYQWLVERVQHWNGYYSVPELLEILANPPTMPGQHSKALVALSINEDLAALAGLKTLKTDHRSRSFCTLHQICLGAWLWRQRQSSSSTKA